MPQYQVTNWRNYSHCDFYDHEALHPERKTDIVNRLPTGQQICRFGSLASSVTYRISARVTNKCREIICNVPV